MNDLALFGNEPTDGIHLDIDLDSIIKSNLENANKISLWTLDAYSVLTAVSARADDLDKQGLLSRFWGTVTGQNRKMSIHNQQDLAHAQLLAQQVLVKLSEQNAISFELALSLSDKLSLLEQDCADAKVKINNAFGKTQAQIKDIYQNLNLFFDKVKSKIEELEAEFRRNDDLLFWKETLLEHKVYKGFYYEDMNNAQKILCMAQEFFTVTKGHWNSRDISFLRSSLRSVGITPDMPIKPQELLQNVQTEPGLLEHLVSKTNFAADFSGLLLDTPMLAALKQTIDVKGSDKHIIDTIASFSPDAKLEDIENAYIRNTVMSKFARNLETEHKAFDVVVDLLGDLLLVELRNSQLVGNTEINVKAELPAAEKYTFDYANLQSPFISYCIIKDIFVQDGQSVHEGQVLASFITGIAGETLYFVIAKEEFTILKIFASKDDMCFGPAFIIDRDVSNQVGAVIKAEDFYEDSKIKSVKFSQFKFEWLDDEMYDMEAVYVSTVIQSPGTELNMAVIGVAVSTDDESYSKVLANYADEKLLVLSVNNQRKYDADDEVCVVVSLKDFRESVS